MARPLWLLLISSMAWAGDDGMPKAYDPGPCEGESVLERVFKGKPLPDSFDELVGQAAEGVGSSSQVTGLDVGDSRSLEREFTSLESPRTILAIQKTRFIQRGSIPSSSPDPDDRLPSIFFGHASAAGRVEALSKVPGKECYKFFLLEDFGPGKKPRMTSPARATCLACHQAGGPILTRFPWAETSFGSFNSNDSVATRLADGRLEALKKAVVEHWAEGFDLKEPSFSGVRTKEQAREIAEFVGSSFRPSVQFTKLVETSASESLKDYTKRLSKDWKTVLPSPPHPDFFKDVRTEGEVQSKLNSLRLPNGASLSSDKILKAAQGDVDRRFPSAKLRNNSTFAFGRGLSFDGGFDLDGIVRTANAALQERKVCKALCADGSLDCKKTLVATAIAGISSGLNPIVSPTSPPTGIGSPLIETLDKKMEAQNKSWPEDGYSYPSSVLPDRDPLLDRDKGGTTRVFYVNDPKAATLGVTGGGGFTQGSVIDKLIEDGVIPLIPKGPMITYLEENATRDGTSLPGTQTIQMTGLKGPSDPKTLRPRIRGIPKDKIASRVAAFAAGTCLGWSDEEVRLLGLLRTTDDAIFNAVEDPKVVALLKGGQWPPKASALATAIIGALTVSKKKADEQLVCDDPLLRVLTGSATDNITTNVEVAREIAQVVQVSKEKILPMFKTYCSECHNEEPFKFDLGNLRKMRDYKNSDNETFQSSLEARDMPPASAKKVLPEQDRALMILLLKDKTQ